MKRPLILLFLFLLSIAIEYSLARNYKQYSLNNIGNPKSTDSIEDTIIKNILDPEVFDEESELVEQSLSTYASGRSVDCKKCCSQGSATDSRCCTECNNCQLYSDTGYHECTNFPHNTNPKLK